MAKAESDDTAKFFTGSISITCPAASEAVGPSFTVCGTFNPTLKCPYRIKIRIFYIDENNQPQVIEIIVVGKSKWKAPVKFPTPPKQGEAVVISAQGYTNTGVAVTHVETTSAIFDSATSSDTCSGPCSA